MSDGPDAIRLPDLDVDSLDEDARAIVAEVMVGRGRLPTPFRVWLSSPALARHLAPLGKFFAAESSLSTAEAEVVILITAHHANARYVSVAHARQAREAGLSEPVVEAIVEGRRPDVDDARQQALVDMMLALTSANDPSDEVFDAAVAALGHVGVADAIGLAGYFTAVGMAMRMYAVPPPARAPRP